MPKTKNKPTRLQLFTAARAVAGVSIEGYATTLGVAVPTIYQTLHYPKKSQRINNAIERFIRENLQRKVAA